MPEAALGILMQARGDAEKAMRDLNKAIEHAGGTASSNRPRMAGFGSSLGDIAKSAIGMASGIGIAQGAISLVRGVADQVSGALFGLNVEFENTEATIMAFTKDAAKTADIMGEIRLEADKTPFAFKDMAKAYAGLMPAAKAAHEPVMQLIKDAEILAASNPAQGLEGAAFALREAVSGDFTSVIERFNLPRSYINQLKDEGVPALEIVRRSMKEMGYDMDLVSNLAKTGTGRWSTLMDTLDSLKMKITKPLFQQLTNGLAVLQGMLDANKETIDFWANTIGTAIGDAATAFGEFIRKIAFVIENGESFDAVFGEWAGIIDQAVAALQPLADEVLPTFDKAVTFAKEHAEEFKGALIAIGAVLAAAGLAIGIAAVAGAIATLANPIGLVVAAVALLGAAWAGNWGDIQGKTAAVIGFIGPLIQKSLQGWTNWWDSHGASVMKVVGALWENQQRGWAMMMAGIEVILDKFGEFWAAHGETITKIARFMWENLKIVAEAALKILGELFDAFAALTEGDWRAFGSHLREAWGIAWGAIADILRNSIDILRDLARQIAKAIWDKITSTDWPAVGKSIVDGLVKGVRDNWNAFFDVVKDLARAAWEAITGFFETGSPSKLMAGLGKDIVAGLELGVNSKMGNVVRLFTNWGGVLFAEMEAWAQGIGGIPAWIVQQFVREFGRLPATIPEFDDFLNRRGWRDPESGQWRFPDTAPGIGKPGFSQSALHKAGILTGFAQIGEEFGKLLSATASAFSAAMQRIESGIDTGLLSRAADAAGGLLGNLQKLGRTLSIEGTTALESAAKMFGDMATKAGIVSQIKDLVGGFEALGLALPPDLLAAIQDIAGAVGGPFADAIKKFLDMAPERKALADLQAFVAEFQLGQQLAAAVAGMLAAGLTIPQALLDMLRKVPRQAGGYLDQIIRQILGLPPSPGAVKDTSGDYTRRRSADATFSTSVTFSGPIYVRNEEDIEILAYRIAGIIKEHR